MRIIAALALFLTGLNAFAEVSDAPAPIEESASRANWREILDKTNLSYAMLLTGPTVRHLDGDLNGKGTYLNFRNYVSAGYDFAKDWEVESGVEFRRYVRPRDPKKPNRSDFEWRDPYAGLSRSNIVRRGNFSLSGKLRYFIPATEYNKSNVGREYDQGNGAVSARVTPAWRRGDFYLSLATELSYRFAEKAPKVRQDYFVKMKPLLSYRFARQWSAKLEYATGDLNHRTNGTWTKFNDPNIGQALYTGVTWTATKQLSMSPSLGWGPGRFQLKETTVSLFASYYIL